MRKIIHKKLVRDKIPETVYIQYKSNFIRRQSQKNLEFER